MDKTTNIYIVNHTHWDREWYRSYNDYLATLKRGTIHLLEALDSGQIDNFYFDGQTIIIEDLKDVLQDDLFDKFINYIKDGKIELGPWYVLPDEGLLDFDSYKTNIKLGLELSKTYELPVGNVLYLPDTFGHDTAVPSLANEFNLEYAIMHRGVTSNTLDVTFKCGEDDVKCIILPTREGYYQTMFHSENYHDELDKYIKAYKARTSSDDVLILNGCDHTFTSDSFKSRLDDFTSKNPNYNVKQVTLSEFFRLSSFEFEEKISGEQREAGIAFVLPGVLSTRQYLKYQNREISDLVTNKYVPIAKLLNKEESESKNITRLLKEIVKNHAHDSICGCSIDEVHREMEVRTQGVYDNSISSIKELLNDEFYYDLKQDIFNDNVVVYNHTNNEVLDIDLTLYLPSKTELANKMIVLETSNERFDMEILSSVEVEKLVHDYKNMPDYQFLVETKVTGQVKINPGELAEFKIIISDTNDSEKLVISQNVIDDFIRKNINYSIITDKGDSYNFDPVGEYYDLDNSIIKQKNYNNFIEVEVQSTIELNESYCFDSKKRSGEMVKFYIVTNLKFYSENRVVANITCDNNLQFVKLVNRIANEDDSTIYSDTAKHLVKRSQVGDKSYRAKEHNTEINYNQRPTQTVIKIGDMNIFHIGQNEMEVIDGDVLTTLFRGIGDLSRRDLDSRRGGAGPNYPTPDCQCKRTLKFDYLFCSDNEKSNHLDLYGVTYHQFRRRDEK